MVIPKTVRGWRGDEIDCTEGMGVWNKWTCTPQEDGAWNSIYDFQFPLHQLSFYGLFFRSPYARSSPPVSQSETTASPTRRPSSTNHYHHHHYNQTDRKHWLTSINKFLILLSLYMNNIIFQCLSVNVMFCNIYRKVVHLVDIQWFSLNLCYLEAGQIWLVNN